jgi:hypothetical protein
MSTRNVSWEVKAAGAQGSQPYHLHVPTVLKSGSMYRDCFIVFYVVYPFTHDEIYEYFNSDKPIYVKW